MNKKILIKLALLGILVIITKKKERILSYQLGRDK